MSEIAPNDFIIEQLPQLLHSSELHDVVGASHCARYLAQQGEVTPAKYNLLATTTRLAAELDTSDWLNEDENSRMRALGIRIGKRLLPGVIRRERAGALLSLAIYKVEEGYIQSEDEATDGFREALVMVPAWTQPEFKGRWLGGHYRRWLKQPLPTDSELLGIAAARKVVKPVISPVHVLDHLYNGHTFRKKAAHRDALNHDFQKLVAKQ